MASLAEFLYRQALATHNGRLAALPRSEWSQYGSPAVEHIPEYDYLRSQGTVGYQAPPETRPSILEARTGRRGRDRSRSRSPRRDHNYQRERSRSSRHRDHSSDRANGDNADSYNRSRAPRDNEDRSSTRRDHQSTNDQNHQAMANPRDNSQQDRRVYVGNLTYDVKWHHLKDHMRDNGTLDVLYADVMEMPNGMSKGCGIVEYATAQQARQAIERLSNTTLMGRMLFVREDREEGPYQGNLGGAARGGYGGGPPRGGAAGGSGGHAGGPGMQGSRSVYITNLPYSAGWQDLKDLCRSAGAVIRADIHTAPDGSPKGSGVVLFETPEDAQNAIATLNGYEWQQRTLEVREDRYAGAGPGQGRGGFGGGRGGGFGARGGFNGGYGGGRGGFGGNFNNRGGFGGGGGGFGRGGYGGGGNYGGGNFGGGNFGGGNFGGGNYGGGNQSGGGGYGGANTAANPFTDGVFSGGSPGPIIHVKNLPWSTSNEDLVELFATIATVKQAEIQYEPNGRSRGSGVVEFTNEEDATTAIQKFQGYQYGGRPLGLDYAKYPHDNEMVGQESQGNLQEQMM